MRVTSWVVVGVLEPRSDVRKGTLAIVADPTGGAIALQKWPL
jgi:hypothetical protein